MPWQEILLTEPHQRCVCPAGSERPDTAGKVCLEYLCIIFAQPYQHLKPSNSYNWQKKIWKLPNHKRDTAKWWCIPAKLVIQAKIVNCTHLQNQWLHLLPVYWAAPHTRPRKAYVPIKNTSWAHNSPQEPRIPSSARLWNPAASARSRQNHPQAYPRKETHLRPGT